MEQGDDGIDDDLTRYRRRRRQLARMNRRACRLLDLVADLEMEPGWEDEPHLVQLRAGLEAWLVRELTRAWCLGARWEMRKRADRPAGG